MEKQIFEWKWRIHKAGLNQKKFCERFGFSPAHFSDWVRGRKQPRYVNIAKVEKALSELGV